MHNMFDLFSGKKVLITGHTGFKGSWLTYWLHSLGAEIAGYSNDIPTQPSLYEDLNLSEIIADHRFDIRDGENLSRIIKAFKPDFLFHLAAQSIVSTAYEHPIDTISTNTLGTANVLNALRQLESKCVAVIITSDKCYENIEKIAGYKESDALGGKDIYSASKAAAENIFHAFQASYFPEKSNIRVATARAGNVVGGGDWAENRIIVDYMKAWQTGDSLTLRNPKATRPWQHVLEPLSGYLVLACHLANNQYQGEAFNFGPGTEEQRTVGELIDEVNQRMPKPIAVSHIPQPHFSEAGLLQLNCDKAKELLSWQATLSFDEVATFVTDWYGRYFSKDIDLQQVMQQQIDSYQSLAKDRGRHWAVEAT